MSKVPRKDRAAVLERASAGGKLTERSIEHAARLHKAAKQRRNVPVERADEIAPEALSDAAVAFAAVQRLVAGVQRAVLDLSRTQYGHRIRQADDPESGPSQKFTGPLKAVWSALKFATPAAVCPTCDGNPHRITLCRTCHRTGWLTEAEFKVVPAKPLFER